MYFNPGCLEIFQKSLRALFHIPLQFMYMKAQRMIVHTDQLIICKNVLLYNHSCLFYFYSCLIIVPILNYTDFV